MSDRPPGAARDVRFCRTVLTVLDFFLSKIGSFVLSFWSPVGAFRGVLTKLVSDVFALVFALLSWPFLPHLPDDGCSGVAQAGGRWGCGALCPGSGGVRGSLVVAVVSGALGSSTACYITLQQLFIFIVVISAVAHMGFDFGVHFGDSGRIGAGPAAPVDFPEPTGAAGPASILPGSPKWTPKSKPI